MEAGGAARPILEATPGLLVILLLVVSGGIRPEGVAAWMKGKGEERRESAPVEIATMSRTTAPETATPVRPGPIPREGIRAVEVAEGRLRFEGDGAGWWRGRRRQVETRPEAADVVESSPRGVDINRATKEELMRLPGIGSVRAEAILAARGKGFATWEEFDRIPGIGPKTMERIRRAAHL